MDEIIYRGTVRINVDVKLYLSLYKKLNPEKVEYWASGWLTGIPLVDRRTRVPVKSTSKHSTITATILVLFDNAIEEYNKYYNAYVNINANSSK